MSNCRSYYKTVATNLIPPTRTCTSQGLTVQGAMLTRALLPQPHASPARASTGFSTKRQKMLKEASHPQPWHHLEKPWCNGGLPASNSHFQQFAFKSYTAQSVVIPKTFSAMSKNELAVIFPCKPSIKSRWCPGCNIYWSPSTQSFLMCSGTTTPRLPFNTMNIMLPHDLATAFDIKALTSVSPVSIDDTQYQVPS